MTTSYEASTTDRQTPQRPTARPWSPALRLWPHAPAGLAATVVALLCAALVGGLPLVAGAIEVTDPDSVLSEPATVVDEAPAVAAPVTSAVESVIEDVTPSDPAREEAPPREEPPPPPPEEPAAGDEPGDEESQESEEDSAAAAPARRTPEPPAPRTAPTEPAQTPVSELPAEPPAAPAPDVRTELLVDKYPLPVGGLAAGPRLQLPSVVELANMPAGDRTTDEVLGLLERARASDDTVARILAPFPVAGPASYVAGPSMAADILAPAGTPVVAAVTGTVSRVSIDANALGFDLVGADGATYRYRGLSALNPMAGEGREVRRGSVIGVVAAGHLRFAVFDRDGQPVNTFALLDRWLRQAREAAEKLAAAGDGVYSPQVAPPESVAAPAAPPATSWRRDLASALPATPDLASQSGTAPGLLPLSLALGLVLLWLARRSPRARPARQSAPALDLPLPSSTLTTRRMR